MCTATWLYSEHGYDLFFNRDELRVRGTARPAEPKLVNAIPCIFPEDSDAGGTWIGVNERGFAACLLNYYGQSGTAARSSYTSRGLLMTSILDCSNTRDAADRVLSLNPMDYRHFSMLLLEPTGPPALLRWTGQDSGPELTLDPSMPKSSSSFKTAEVVASRKGLLTSHYQFSDTDDLALYHRSHEPERGPYSVCMHREDARTVSFSHVAVTRDTIVFDYTPGSPCITEPAPQVAIRRRG
jgi:hypothetical protein